VHSLSEALQSVDFPDFLTPPVEKVILSCKFKRANDFGIPGLVDFMRSLNADPQITEHPWHDSPVESFAARQRSRRVTPRVKISVSEAQPSVRFAMPLPAPDMFLQLQPDWLAVNWEGRGQDYPRWDSIKPAFMQIVSDLESAMGSMAILQCDVTYVNRIPSDAESLIRGFHLVDNNVLSSALPPPEDVFLHTHHLIGGKSASSPAGRLHVDVDRAGSDYILLMTARGPARTLDQADATMDSFHEVIVKSFATLLDADMVHKFNEEQQ